MRSKTSKPPPAPARPKSKLDTTQRREQQLRALQQQAWELESRLQSLQAKQLQLEAWEVVVTHQELMTGMHRKLLGLHGAADAQAAGTTADTAGAHAASAAGAHAADAAGARAADAAGAYAADAAGAHAADAATQAAGAHAADAATQAAGTHAADAATQAAGAHAGDAVTQAAGAGAGAEVAAQPDRCVQPSEPWLQAVCAKVLGRYPLLDALDKLDVRMFGCLRHMTLEEYAALWRGHLSELALLVSCAERTDTAAQLLNVCVHTIALGKSAFVLNPALPMSMIGYNMIACRHEALPGAEHWREAAAAAQLREEQVALVAAVVRVVAPRVAAADRRRQEVAEAAADTAGSMLSALSSSSSGSVTSFHSSGRVSQRMVGELDKRARVWRVEAPMGEVIACMLQPRQLASVIMRSFPFFPHLFAVLDGFNDVYFDGKAPAFSISSGENS